jgi:cytochrome c oxidase subunit I+III
LLASAACVFHADRCLKPGSPANAWHPRIALLLGVLLLLASFGAEWHGHWQSGLRPQESGYGASVYALVGLQGFFVLIIVFMGIYTVARSLAGLLHAERRVTFENTMLFWHYTIAQGLIAIALLHSFPRLIE